MGAKVGLEVVQSDMWMSVHVMCDREQVTRLCFSFLSCKWRLGLLWWLGQ